MKSRHSKRLAARRFTFLRGEQLEERTVLSVGVGVYFPVNDTFWLRNTPTAGPNDAGEFQFDAPGALPVVGDWNGDGQDDFGIYDTSNGTWSLRYGAEPGPPNAGVFQ